MFWCGFVRLGKEIMVGRVAVLRGVVWYGMVSHGKEIMAGCCVVRYGMASPGLVIKSII